MMSGMDQVPVFPIANLLARRKAKSYRERIFKLGKALLGFLKSNGLAKHPLLGPDGEPDPTRDVWGSDLTPEGAALMEQCLDRWLGYTDRGGDPENVEILRKALAKMRKQ